MKNIIVLWIAGWWLVGSVIAADPATRPNVLLIVCDDLNTHVSTSGYRHIRTPAFDALARGGMRFGRA
ncbi:MAG: arylsulfatase, partial [Planctomycetota bacterium]|nr:arylsulfatase [Planctomycetota bacterium]